MLERQQELSVRRIARSLFGAILVLGAFAMVLFSLPSVQRQHPTAAFTSLVVTWLAALLARYASPPLLRKGLPLLLGRTELAGGAQNSPSAALSQQGLWSETGDKWKKRGLVLPLVGAALIGPLSLHALFALADPKDFGQWVLLSAVIVGHAHVILALFATLHGLALCQGKKGESVARTLFVITIVSCVPGAIFLLPPVIVFITGVVVIPTSFLLARSIAEKEQALESAASRPSL